jgi:hypothetical protein
MYYRYLAPCSLAVNKQQTTIPQSHFELHQNSRSAPHIGARRLIALLHIPLESASSTSSTMATTMANSKKPNNDAPAGPIESASSSADQQVHSKIMHLPQEIRDEIYANVFCSTHFTYAFEDHLNAVERRVEPSARETGLALLRTCRRVRGEIGISWLHQVLFNFLDAYTLLDKLADIPITLREQIRHVCVSGSELSIVNDEGRTISCNTAQVLKMLPGLELDTLTVIGTGVWHPSDNLDRLIHHSDGWKELHYLSDNSEPLAYKVDVTTTDSPQDAEPEYAPRPRPSDWQNLLEQRDGQASHPSIVAYQATTLIPAPGATTPVLHPCIRETFTRAATKEHIQKLSTQEANCFVKFEDATPITPETLEKPMLVVVKRGVGVDYAEKEGSPLLPFGDIRKFSPGMTWTEIHRLDKDFHLMICERKRRGRSGKIMHSIEDLSDSS